MVVVIFYFLLSGDDGEINFIITTTNVSFNAKLSDSSMELRTNFYRVL